jgi:hypothetical protein
MKTSELLMGAATLIVTTFAVVWFVHRLWHAGLRRRGLSSGDRRDDEPILWI